MTSDALVAPRSPGVAPVPIATVGVVIPTYNHAHFLGEALESVRAQTRAADAVVVVDDGSDDHPEQVVARFSGARCIRQDNRGLAAARNAGLAALNTRYVIFLDADDRLEPGAIAAGLACFARQRGDYLDEGGSTERVACSRRNGGRRVRRAGRCEARRADRRGRSADSR